MIRTKKLREKTKKKGNNDKGWFIAFYEVELSLVGRTIYIKCLLDRIERDRKKVN